LDALFCFLIIIGIIGVVTICFGPNWWLWISIVCWFILGMVGWITKDNSLTFKGLMEGILLGIIMSMGMGIGGLSTRYFQQKGRKPMDSFFREFIPWKK
jgi:hypothetical protein